jgi:hypothetical protein
VRIVDSIEYYRPDKADNPGDPPRVRPRNIQDIKIGFTFLEEYCRNGRDNIIKFIDLGVPKMVVEILTSVKGDFELDNISCNLIFIITIMPEGISACFKANVERLLVEVINRTIPRINNKENPDMINNIFYKAISSLTKMASQDINVIGRLEKSQNIDALRHAGVSDAILAVRSKTNNMGLKKRITELLPLLDYNDDGSNRRAPPPKRTALGALRGLLGMRRGGGSRKKPKVRKAITRRR